MKKTFSLLLFLFVCEMGYSQPKQPHAVVACTKMNILYYGVDNPVSIAIPEVADIDIVVETTGGTISAQGNGHYIIYPIRNDSNIVSVKVFSNVKNKKKSMGKYVFRVKNIPLPEALIFGKNSGTINKSILIASPGINAVLSDFDFGELQFTVISYTFTYKQNDKMNSIEVNGNKFTEEVLKIIKELPLGAEISFENIKSIGANSNFTLNPIVFIVN